MSGAVLPFLMFQGDATAATDFYLSVFPDAVLDVTHRDDKGALSRASLTVGGQALLIFDSPMKHDFGFTPAFSLMVACDDADEVDRLAAILSEGGGTMMPPGDYGFAPRFAWVNDRFGVSWQLMFESDRAT